MSNPDPTPLEASPIILHVARRLRFRREELKQNQTDMAAQLGVSQSGYSQYELGKVPISLEHLVQFAAILKVPLGYFFKDFGTGTKRSPPETDFDRFVGLAGASEIATLFVQADRRARPFMVRDVARNACRYQDEAAPIRKLADGLADWRGGGRKGEFAEGAEIAEATG